MSDWWNKYIMTGSNIIYTSHLVTVIDALQLPQQMVMFKELHTNIDDLTK